MNLHEENLQLWLATLGDETLALDWPIDEHAVVWEIGGFEGRWAAQMVEKYNPLMYIFEPQMWAYAKLIRQFEGNPKVSVHPVGLWTYDTILRLWEHDTDGASVVKRDGRASELCSFTDIFHPHPTEVDVCLMNIEGGEFVLLPYLLGLEQMRRFRFFWCQFHPGVVAHGQEKADLIYKGLAKTHRVMWDYYPVAVAWERL